MNSVRLDPASLDRLGPDVRRPAHLRSATPSIVHLGVGAFARGHLGIYADDLCAAGHPSMIRGVSIRSERAENELAPQDGLYSVLEREPGQESELRVIGSLHSVVTGPDAAIEAIADARTELVTLTVTEKGYRESPAERRSVGHVIAAGLHERPRGSRAPVIASLDNVADNGDVIRSVVLDAARLIDAALAEHIAAEVQFPTSVVDRIVPATTERDLDEIESRLGVRDEAAVVAEHHRSWAITDVPGLPPLAEVGVDVVDDIEPYQRRKLWLLNGPHSALAYLGLLAECDTIAEAVEHPVVSSFVRSLVDDVLAVADLPPEVAAADFASETLRRFANPDLGHTCIQVGADGSTKLPQRILPVVALAERAGRPTDRFALVVATWFAAVAGLAVGGRTVPAPSDPLTDLLHSASEAPDRMALLEKAFDGAARPTFMRRVDEALASLVTHGERAIGEKAF